ncbi:hypothetical protein [Citrobacter amalonaticus]|uniref:hypothetical protein n=1 Tax=Citrobacter amalonaticus TaxID=35703 RepID=UPI0021F247D2|nr:hypothetical protein [Citrobacter amalonaticus]
MAVGEGARQAIMSEIGKLGSTTLEIHPGTGWGSKRPDMSAHCRWTMCAVYRRCRGSWASRRWSAATLAVRKGLDSSMMLSGVSQDFFALQGLRFVQGNALPHATSRKANRC